MIEYLGSSLDSDLCQLLESMKLSEQQALQDTDKNAKVSLSPTIDISMCKDQSSQPDVALELSGSRPNLSVTETFGCAYLQAIQAQLEMFPEVGTVYLDTIFTHREIFLSFPQAHPHCSRGFSDMAYALEQRAWHEEPEAANDAIAAFRHEAWTIAMSLRDASSKHILQSGTGAYSTRSSSACHLMPQM